ncbi:MAG: patatin-like phospholipase family protein, partial [Acidobacteria bacterium]|nr:patatin-like phospholipase family protein [Acidobacteriota bacterium]
MMRRAAILVLAFVFVCAVQTPAQKTETPPQAAVQRPKVGVALAGGGARGFAHIGFLKWLEHNRIPVDYISGTSMGALVGSAYATGKSPEEIEALFDGMDWDAVLNGKAPYEQLSYRRKEDDRRYPNTIEFGLRKKQLSLPRGLVSNHAVGLILDRFALPFWQAPSFDDLPIPFRCVATDLVKGEAVTFRDGSLSQALRATMAIPGVFTPVRHGGQLLVDGGILNNLPTEALVEMGADVVIAVRLSRLPRNPDELPLGGIVDGAIDVVLENNERKSVETARQKVRVIFLTLDVGEYTSMDFAQAKEIAARGEQVAQDAVAELQALARQTEAGWEQWRDERRTRARNFKISINRIEVSARKADAQREIESQVAHGGGQPLDPPRLENTLTKIFGIGRYDSLGYQVQGSPDRPELRIDAEEKFHGPPFVRMLAEVNGSETDNIQFNFLARFTAMDVGRYGAEWRTDVSIGSRTALASEYDTPIGRSKFFLAPRLQVERSSRSLFAGRDRVAEYMTDRAFGALDLGYRFGRTDEVRAGVELGHIDARVRVGNPLLPRLQGAVSRVFVRWSHDGQD